MPDDIRIRTVPFSNTDPSAFAHYIKWPDPSVVDEAVPFPDVEMDIKAHLAANTLAEQRDKAVRGFGLIGEPGTGKTAAIVRTCRKAGYALMVIPSSELASRFEGGATEALRAIFDSMVQLSRAHRIPFALLLDDFDTSSAIRDDKTSGTVNSGQLNGMLQNLFSQRALHRNYNGSNIAIFLTANDLSHARSSLFRDERVNVVVHRVDLRFKRQVAHSLFKPSTFCQRAAVNALVWRYRKRSVAFWQAVARDLEQQRLRVLLPQHGIDLAAISVALKQSEPLNVQSLRSVVRRRARTKLENFL